MSAEQKALLRQLQLAGLGIVISATALFMQNMALAGAGLFVFVLGIARFFLIRKLQSEVEKHGKDD